MQHARHPRLCPHCAKPLQPIRFGVAFGPLAAQIIDTIEKSGSRGVSVADLFAATYGQRNGASLERLRSYVSAINRALHKRGSGVTIRSDRRAYRLVERRRP